MMVYHIATKHDWHTAQTGGAYSHASLETDGFIHFSTADQVESVANTFFAGLTDLLLLHVDTELLTAELRYDDAVAPDGTTQKFPHLYGTLNLDAIMTSTPIERDDDGKFHFSEPA